ncbi:hypothetical protein GEMRC1_010217 [Eukaryota sp. GEM-RC1]
MTGYLKATDILEFSSVITHLKTADCYFVHLLNQSVLLPCLRVLDISFYESRFSRTPPSNESFTSFCEYLMVNTTVKELNIDFGLLSRPKASVFAAVFHSNRSLQKLSLCAGEYENHECLLLITTSAKNAGIAEIDLSKLLVTSPNCILPLLQSSSLRSIALTRYCDFSPIVFNAFKFNASLREVSFFHLQRLIQYVIAKILLISSNLTLR